jgi:hypothetical protein
VVFQHVIFFRLLFLFKTRLLTTGSVIFLH